MEDVYPPNRDGTVPAASSRVGWGWPLGSLSGARTRPAKCEGWVPSPAGARQARGGERGAPRFTWPRQGKFQNFPSRDHMSAARSAGQVGASRLRRPDSALPRVNRRRAAPPEERRTAAGWLRGHHRPHKVPMPGETPPPQVRGRDAGPVAGAGPLLLLLRVSLRAISALRFAFWLISSAS